MREQRKISGIKKEERECIKKLFPYIPFTTVPSYI